MGEGTSPLRRFRKPDTFMGAVFRTCVMTARLGLPNPSHTRKRPMDLPIHREQLGKKEECSNPVGVGSPNPYDWVLIDELRTRQMSTRPSNLKYYNLFSVYF